MILDRNYLAAALALLAPACTPDLRLPADGRFACTRNEDCPTGYACRQSIGMCVRADSDDQTPPVASAIAMTPSPLKAGSELRVTFEVDEPLAQSPLVSLGGEPLAEAEHGAFSFIRIITGLEGDGQHAVTARLVDLAGNEAVQDLGVAVIDTTPPRVYSLRWRREGRTAIAGSGTLAYDGRTDGDATVVETYLVDQEGTRLARMLDPSFTIDPDTGLQDLTGQAVLDGVDFGGATGLAAEVVLSDPAGNLTPAWTSRTDTLDLDLDWPTNLGVTVLGPSPTQSLVVSIALSAEGATEVLVAGHVVDDAGTFDWRPYVSVVEVTLTPGNGDKTISVSFRDGAYHEAGPLEAHVELQLGTVDTRPPDLISPADGELARNRTTTLRWSPRVGATTYDLVIVDAATRVTVHSETLSGTVRPDVVLPAARSYAWQVSSDVQQGVSNEATIEAIDDRVYVYCAADPCDSGGAGNLTHPRKTVGGAINLATALGLGRVDVANRPAAAPYVETVVLSSGISLYGGYDPTFTTRGAPTRLRGVGLVTVLGQALTDPTTVDGLAIDGPASSAGDSYALFVRDAGPDFVLRNCTVTGSVAGQTAYGALLSGSSPASLVTLDGSAFAGGVGSSSVALAIDGGSVLVQDCGLEGRGGTLSNIGVRIAGLAEVTVEACPVIGGYSSLASATAAGMVVASGLVTVSGGTHVEAVAEGGMSSITATTIELAAGSLEMNGGTVHSQGTSTVSGVGIAMTSGELTLRGTVVTVADTPTGSPDLVGIAITGALPLIATLEDVQVTTGSTAGGGSSTGVSMDRAGTLSIVRSTIAAGGPNSGRSVVVSDGTAVIAQSTLTVGAASTVVGLTVEHYADVTLASSVVLPGQGSSSAAGLLLSVGAGEAARVSVHNSTIFSGTATSGAAVAVSTQVPGDAPVTLGIVNSALVLQAAGPSSYCIQTSDLNDSYSAQSDRPKWLRHNAFIGCDGAYLKPDDASPVTDDTALNTASVMTEPPGVGAAVGNIAVTLAASGLDAIGRPGLPTAPQCRAGLLTTNAVCGNGSEPCGPVDPDRALATRTCPDPDPGGGSYDCFSIGAYECQ